eukprot:12284953-Alexandrium_andersonii.AAC.1
MAFAGPQRFANPYWLRGGKFRHPLTAPAPPSAPHSVGVRAPRSPWPGPPAGRRAGPARLGPRAMEGRQQAARG